jgi:uncharacterized protein
MKEIILGPWAWYVVGPLISLVMFSMFYFGKTFGVSSNFRTLCTMLGAAKFSDFFKFDWRAQIWNLVFILGTLIGGFVAKTFLTNYDMIQLSESTQTALANYGVAYTPGTAPTDLFSWGSLLSLKGFILIVLGGFLVGFGTRYAGGCTSGHAITGLSNLQIPSLVAVIGFFMGGLVMTWLIMPYIFSL